MSKYLSKLETCVMTLLSLGAHKHAEVCSFRSLPQCNLVCSCDVGILLSSLSTDRLSNDETSEYLGDNSRPCISETAARTASRLGSAILSREEFGPSWWSSQPDRICSPAEFALSCE